MQNQPSLTGRSIRHFHIGELIGAGGMGEVYRAKDTKLGRDVAIKVLPGSLANDPSRRNRFEQEARALAALNHPHIAAIYGLEETEDGFALVLELVEGPTLADRLQSGAIPLKDALRIAHQLAEALDAAHEKGIVHRDLKPANIKITSGGAVKVLDFGLAKAFAGENAGLASTNVLTGTQQGVILGTPAYMSPEQATGQEIDKRTDIWAFGCVVYEMLSGRQPFPGESVTDVVTGILSREPDWNALSETAPDNLRRLLRRCLEKDPKRRLHHITDARLEIDEFLAGPTKPETRSRPAVRGRRAIAAVVAGFLLAALVGYLLIKSRANTGAISGRPDRLAEATERQITTNSLDAPIVFAAISPDGKYVAYSDAAAIYLRLIDTGETRMLSVPQGLCFL
jgi:serine/threonine-protein kinase